MASGLYDSAREAFLTGSINADTADIRAILIDAADYTVDLANHDFLNDVASGARVATSGSLASTTVADGVFDASDVTFTAVTGDSVEAIVLYVHTGVESTSNLIAYIDSVTGFPLTPNGGDVIVAWDSGTNRIFKL